MIWVHVKINVSSEEQELCPANDPLLLPCWHFNWRKQIISTVKSRFNESWFNVKSRFKEWYIVTKMKFHIKKSRFRVKSRFKESKCDDPGHSLNRDFTV